MPSLNERYRDAILLRSVELQSVATWLLGEYLQKLERLQKDIVAAIAFHDPREPGPALEELVEQVKDKIAEVYDELRRRLEADSEELQAIQEEFERDTLFAVFGVTVAAAAVASVEISGLSVLGLTITDWMKRQQADLEFRAIGNIRRGVEAGDSLGALIERVKGTSELEGESLVRVVDPSRRALTQATRTIVEGVATRARERVAEALPPDTLVIPQDAPETALEPKPRRMRYGWQQISILDGRTSAICRRYAFKIWNANFEPIGHDLPYNGGVPRHPHCRSQIVMILLDEDPSKDLTFAKWQASIAEEEKKKAFGSKAYELFKSGKLDASGLLRSTEKQLTFDDLRKRAPHVSS